MADNRSVSEKYENPAAAFGPTIRDYEGRFGDVYGDVGNIENYNRQQAGKFANKADIDPEAFVDQFIQNANPLASVVTGRHSALAEAGREMDRNTAIDAFNAEASRYAGMGAGDSSAGIAASSRALGDVLAQSNLRNRRDMLGATGNLWNQAMGGLQQGNIAAGQQAGNMAGLFANQAANNLGLRANMAGQGFTVQEPTLVAKPTGFQSAMGNISSALSPIAGAVGTGVGAATGLSNLGGGLANMGSGKDSGGQVGAGGGGKGGTFF